MRNPIGTLSLLAALAAPPGCNDSCAPEDEEQLNGTMDKMEEVFRLGVKSFPDGSNDFYQTAWPGDVETLVSTYKGQAAQCAVFLSVLQDKAGMPVHRHIEACSIATIGEESPSTLEIARESGSGGFYGGVFLERNGLQVGGIDLGTKFCHEEACSAACSADVDGVGDRIRQLIVEHKLR